MVGQFDKIKAASLASIESVLNRWLPGGQRKGREYLALNPNRADSKPGSFSINLDSGAWADFATGDKGGDLVSLVAYVEGKKQGEAAKLLADFLGVNVEKTDPQKRATSVQNQAGNSQAPAQENKTSWRPVLPVPANSRPPKAHPKHGLPSMQWEYLGEDGSLRCLVYRFEPKADGERKQFCPLTWCESADGKRRAWRWQGLPEPRPLYHLDQLAARDAAAVIVCEGEKAADAASLLFPECVAVTMLNGAQAPAKTDWRPLAGRTVWLWPDNDAPGLECMATVARLAGEAGAAMLKMIDLSAFARTPSQNEAGEPVLLPGSPVPEKWDAADALAGGWTAAHVFLLRKEGGILVNPPKPSTSTNTADKNERQEATDLEPPRTRFHCNDEGVWYFGKNENGTEAPPLWVCSRLEITAVTRDAKNESWGRLLEFDDLDGQHHAWAMPMEMLKGDGAEYRGVLLSMGLQMSTMTKARNLLTQYIQTAPVDQRARCVERTGWHGRVFVMPERTLGDAGERILFQSSTSTPSTFKQRGQLSDWKQNIAGLCSGNSRLVFAVSAALAAPLLEMTGIESGGFHFRGDSSTGKTTALRVAASVWGGLEYLQRWRATDNGLEALAAQHSDCLLVLDEISQVDPKAAGEVAYMLANGSGKARASRTGTMRETANWRLLFLSSGEAGLAEHMAQANRKPKAGQEIRLLDIPADAGAGQGMFEDLHHYAGGAAFSRAITEAVSKHYGTAALSFLLKLVKQPPDWAANAVKRQQREFKAAHVPENAGGQVERAALRFALVGTAGEMATDCEITGWQPGEAMSAAAACFKAWLNQRGSSGNLEEVQMLAQIRRFFEVNGEARFTDWNRPVADDTHAPKTVNRAGYRRHIDAQDEEGRTIYTGEYYPEGDEKIAKDTEYYVFPVTFEQEVCAGFDYRAVCRLMADRGMLLTEGKSFKRKERLPGGEYPRCYRVTSKIFSDE